MKFNIQYKIATVVLLVASQYTFAQKKDENLGTEVVNVVKPYSPSISDAFKVKETPMLDDEQNTKKEEVKYNIFSFPVASTFKPSKGKAAVVDKEKQESLFKNYASFAAGNYVSFNGELFVTEDINDTDYIAGEFLHQSSLGNIDNVPLESGYSDTSFDLIYGSSQDEYSWNADLGYDNKMYNWYGLPLNFGTTITPDEKNSLINAIDPLHAYNSLYLNGKIKFNEGIFDQMSLKYNYFFDSYGSFENHFYVKPEYNFSFANQNDFRVNFLVDYVGGLMSKSYFNESVTAPEYDFIKLGFNPNYIINKGDLSLNVGLNLAFNFDNQTEKNKVYVYPKLVASYKLVEDLMIAYGGLEGDLKMNSYHDFVNKNPFLSPTLTIKPTDNMYDFYLGMRGKLASFLGYDVKGTVLGEKNKALFKSNDYNEKSGNENYEYGNSFGIVYDKVRTFSFFGELKADFTKEIAFAVNGTFNSYKLDDEADAWNLPAFKLESYLDVDFFKKWNANVRLFYVGSRKDSQLNTDIVYITAPAATTLAGYFDANAKIGYKYNERITGFLKFNNLFNQNYSVWMNFPVQQFQVLLGASYKFDF